MVELMVVIIIMAILGMAVIPSLMGSSDKAKYSRAWSDLTTISNAFTAFYGRVGNLPSIAKTVFEPGAIGTVEVEDDENVIVPNEGEEALLQSFLGTPLDEIEDPWGNKYGIASDWDSANGKGYIIVYVDKGTTTGGTATFGTGITATARLDPYNDNMPMAKLIINVPTGEETP